MMHTRLKVVRSQKELFAKDGLSCCRGTSVQLALDRNVVRSNTVIISFNYV